MCDNKTIQNSLMEMSVPINQSIFQTFGTNLPFITIIIHCVQKKTSGCEADFI